MDPTDISLFRAAEQRLAWVDRRQQLLAQNVANADTPGYRARDVAPFAAMLAAPGLSRTSAMHLDGSGAPGGSGSSVGRWSERAPAGNTISVEDQLSKVADTAGVQQLVLNLHHAYQGMMRTALGRTS